MARTRPIRIGQWIHNGLHLALVALAVALISGTAYALAVGGKDALGTLIAGALISLLDDIGIILLYNAQSSLLAVTIVADIFAIALCAVGVIVVALSGLGRGDDPNPQPQEHRKSDDAEYIALSLSLTLLGCRVVSVVATGVLSCVIARRRKREREGEELSMQ